MYILKQFVNIGLLVKNSLDTAPYDIHSYVTLMACVFVYTIFLINYKSMFLMYIIYFIEILSHNKLRIRRYRRLGYIMYIQMTI